MTSCSVHRLLGTGEFTDTSNRVWCGLFTCACTVRYAPVYMNKLSNAVFTAGAAEQGGLGGQLSPQISRWGGSAPPCATSDYK